MAAADQRIVLLPFRRGGRVHRKVSYPSRCGRYHELRAPTGVWHLALDGFPKFFQAQGRGVSWPHPQEWLKTTRRGDLVYYSTQGYGDLFDLTGEYYYPLPNYPTNALYQPDPAQARVTAAAADLCEQARCLAARQADRYGADDAAILRSFAAWDEAAISAFGRALHRAIGARIPVLPPDCRHVDYDVLPLIVAEGCLANCGFCRIKTGNDFRVRNLAEVETQLTALCSLFGLEWRNFRGVFLGQHDGLAAGGDLLAEVIATVRGRLTAKERHVDGLDVFLFASPTSFLAMDGAAVRRLGDLGCRVYVNIGLESFDQGSLDRLQRPVSAAMAAAVFDVIVERNRQGGNVRFSANLVLGDRLGSRHLALLEERLASLARPHPETVIYLSPLFGEFEASAVIKMVRKLKRRAKVSVSPYLILRL